MESSDDEWEFENKDQVCLVCHIWAQDDEDLHQKFRCCKRCPQVFHKRCIPPYFRNCTDDHDCATIFKNEQIKLKCCNPREKNSAFQTAAGVELYDKRNYVNKRNNEGEIYWYPSNRRKRKQIRQRYRRDEYANINVSYF